MLKKIMLLSILIAFSFNAWASRPKVPMRKLTPPGWSVFAKTLGDLNRDKKKDLAVVFEKKKCSGTCPRELRVYFQTKPGEYRLVAKNRKAILTSDQGGVFGDPFNANAITIKKGSLHFSFYGGSAWRWGESYQFRYQQDRLQKNKPAALYLIGRDSDSTHSITMTGSHTSRNLLTGKTLTTTTLKNGKKKKKWSRPGRKKLINLQEFEGMK